jgi:hypothetical protein
MCLQPGSNLLRNAQVGDAGLTNFFKGLLGFFASESAIAVEELAQSGRYRVPCALNPKGFARGVGNDVDYGRLSFPGFVETAAISGLKVMESGLNMLAGAEAVDAEIYTGAEEEALAQTTNLYGISHATSGANPEVREDGMIAAHLSNA